MSVDPNDTEKLLELLEQGTKHLSSAAKNMDFPWDTSISDPRKLHNMYVRNIITAYVSKYADLSQGLIDAVRNSNFLTYAMCARGLIENTATLRYYVIHQYLPLMNVGKLNYKEMMKLIDIDDRHLRGSRFDWESFLNNDYMKMTMEASQELRDKKKKKSAIASRTTSETAQVSVLTCIEKWSLESPEVKVTYDLFCDLVHPNIGSNFMVASTSADQLYFSRHHGEPFGLRVVKQSLPILLSVTQKQFGEYLGSLMKTVWQDDEL